jgi:hypothetical protein
MLSPPVFVPLSIAKKTGPHTRAIMDNKEAGREKVRGTTISQ